MTDSKQDDKSQRKKTQEFSTSMISDMVLGPERKSSKGDLVVEPTQNVEQGSFKEEINRTLDETARGVVATEGITAEDRLRSWDRAREIVADFHPVPWFIWRLSNFVLGKGGQINPVQEGLVYGLRRLLFAAATDDVLGAGMKVNSVKQALKVLEPDVLAATAVIHAVCKRLASRQFERIWRPILDDALLRARIGIYAGAKDPYFGKGRGMLAGFSGRSGLAILIATGELDQARQALELLATGTAISEVGLGIYQCEPLQVSAMTLSAAGVGRDAALGTAAYAANKEIDDLERNAEQLIWLSAFSLCENIRQGTPDQISDEHWEALGYDDIADRQLAMKEAKQVVRRGHSWSWIV